MIKLSWQEITDLRHVAINASCKCAKFGFMKEAEFFEGFAQMVEDVTTKHEGDKDDKRKDNTIRSEESGHKEAED